MGFSEIWNICFTFYHDFVKLVPDLVIFLFTPLESIFESGVLPDWLNTLLDALINDFLGLGSASIVGFMFGGYIFVWLIVTILKYYFKFTS